jgi:hypothetical protein
MKNFFLILILLILTAYAGIAQPTCAWMKNAMCTSNDEGDVIWRDNYGNVYVAGVFTGEMQIGFTVFNSIGDKDVFVAKYSATGQLLWAKNGGSIAKERVSDIVTDAAGNIYVSGSYGTHDVYVPGMTDTMYFDANQIVSNGHNDAFLVKFSANGDIIWLKGYGTIYGEDVGAEMTISNNQQLLLTGQFGTYGGSPPMYGTMSLGSISMNSSQGYMYVVCIDTAGNGVWGKQYQAAGEGISKDAAGNIYIVGQFDGNISFDGHMANSVSSGFVGGDIFIAKFTPIGTAMWVKTIGGVNSGSSVGGALYSPVISVAAYGDVFMSGYYFHCSLKFQNGTTLPYNSQGQGFFARYTTDGTLKWAKAVGDENYSGFCSGIAVDNEDHIYVSGYFNTKTWFSSDTLISNGGNDLFIAKYDSAGGVQWVINAGGASGDYASGIAINNDASDIFVTGGFASGTFQWGTQIITNSGGNDMFIAKLTQPNTGIANNNKVYEVAVYPNPTTGEIHITTPERGYAQAVLYDVTGREVMRQRIDAEKTTMQAGTIANGVYYLQLKGEGQKTTEKVIIQH